MVNGRYYKTISYFFMLYGKENEEERIKAYASKLQDIPLDVLKTVLNKMVLTCKFVPSIAEIVEAGRELVAEAQGNRVKTWQEAQKEIAKGLNRTWFKGCLGEIPVDHPEYGLPCEPMWSTPEIAAAVNSYGMDNLAQVLVDDMPTVWAQLRRLYEQACQRKDDKAVNVYVLGGDVEMLQRAVENIGLLKEGKRTPGQ